MSTYSNIDKEIEEIEKESAKNAEYINAYMSDKEENNVFVRKTRENVTKEFFDSLDKAINNPLL